MLTFEVVIDLGPKMILSMKSLKNQDSLHAANVAYGEADRKFKVP